MKSSRFKVDSTGFKFLHGAFVSIGQIFAAVYGLNCSIGTLRIAVGNQLANRFGMVFNSKTDGKKRSAMRQPSFLQGLKITLCPHSVRRYYFK